MGYLPKALLSFFVLSSISGCGFPDSKVSESEKRLAEREKILQSYRAIQGVYEGEIRTPEASMSAQVYLGYTEIQAGQDADGRPIFQPRLTARLIRRLVTTNDVSMTGDFEPGAGILTLTSSLKPGANDASEVFYLRARFAGEAFSGDLRVRDQFYGRLSVSRTSQSLPANWEFDDGGLSERAKKIAAYKKIQGRYEGVIELGSRVISTRVTVSYIEIPNGFDVNNRPRYNVLLTLRLSRPELIVNDVTLRGDFDPLNRVVTGADPSLSGGGVGGGAGDVGAPLPGGQQAEAFYFSGRVYEKDPLELVGELRTKEQFYGRLRVVRVFEQVPSPADLDEELFNQILNLLKPLEGRYRAEHLTDKLEVLDKFEIRVVTGSSRLPSLMINYRRNEFTAAVTANLLYRPGFTPPKLSFSTSYSAGTGGFLLVSFDGELKPDGTIQGVLTHGNLSGPLRAKKLAP